jgi:hypothetical protein
VYKFPAGSNAENIVLTIFNYIQKQILTDYKIYTYMFFFILYYSSLFAELKGVEKKRKNISSRIILASFFSGDSLSLSSLLLGTSTLVFF